MKQFFSKISRRTWIIIGVVLVALVVFLFTRSNGEEIVAFQTVAAERDDLIATVGATGSVRARQTAILVWQTNGIIGSVNAKIGDVVSQDFVLASLDKSSLNQSIILAEADLINAQQALEDLLTSDTALLEAQKAVDKAEDAYEKAYNWRKQLNGKIEITETWWEFGVLKSKTYKGFASEETIAQADKDLALAESKLNDARREYERLLKGEESTDVTAATARVEAAQATLNLARLAAPFDGTITQSNPSVGDQVTSGAVGFRIDDLSSRVIKIINSPIHAARSPACGRGQRRSRLVQRCRGAGPLCCARVVRAN